jgi:glutamate--cysteine ligase regulatory subunit
MGSGNSISQRPLFEKSNTELVNGLKTNFYASQEDSEQEYQALNGSADGVSSAAPKSSWIARDGELLYIPDLNISESGLAEERSQYEITVKLFFLPTTDVSKPGAHAEDAINLVLRELRVPSIDLLIISFPGITFDADDEELDEPDGQPPASPALDEMILTWRTLEALHKNGTIRQIGLSEFGSERLKTFLPKTRIRPSVDQINVRDCCVVPKSLILFAKQEKLELLTHNDCVDILPKGTIRELLEQVAKLLGDDPDSRGILASLKGEIEPQWVIKYTAVVSDRGVIENKGYFAMAHTGSS